MRSVPRGALHILLALSIPGVARSQFINVTQPPLDLATGLILGASWGDVDRDGDLDLFASNFQVDGGSKLFRQDAAGVFADVTSTEISTGTLASGSFGDFDEDGDLDLYLNAATSGADNRLLRNDGTGSFISFNGGDLSPSSSGRGCTWLDFDGDGDLDLNVVRTGGTPPSSLLRHNFGVSFTDVAVAPMNVAVQTMTWSDYDQDGDADAFVATTTSFIGKNNGSGTFSSIGNAAVTGAGLDADWGDFDNDQDMDLFVAHSSANNRLLRNDGGDVFVDVTPPVLLGPNSGRTVTWADFDNDADLDIVLTVASAPVVLARNDGGGNFSDASSLLPAAATDMNSATWGDFDRDGDLDLYMGRRLSGTSMLLRNDSAGSNHWLHINLEGSISNRDGSGARVTAVAGGMTQVRELFLGGQGWASQGSPTVEFGLGSATLVNTLTIRWPSGSVQTLSNVTVDRLITVSEPGFPPIAALSGGFVPGGAFDLILDTFGASVTEASLSFRAAGSGGAFLNTTMTIDDVNDRLTGAISGAAASENGVEYVVTYRLNNGVSRSFPREGASRPAFFPANLGNRSQPAAAPTEQYVLFALPFVAANASLGAVLEDDLGVYDPKKWRFGRFAPSLGTYLEAGNAGSIVPGRGFWLIEKTPVVIDAQGVSTNTVGGTPILVDPGWNQIGHPYLFTVATSAVDFSQAPNVTNRFVSRVNDAYVDVNVLEPWKGYWVFNGGGTTQTILIPGEASAPPAPIAGFDLDRFEWGIEAAARTNKSADMGNIAAVSRDPIDSDPEPPAMPGTVRAYFLREGEAVREWTTDVREVNPGGQTWKLIVDAPQEETTTVSFAGMETLPVGMEAALISFDTFSSFDLRATNELLLRPGMHRFHLAVGPPSYIDAARSGGDAAWSGIALGTAYPNPFSGETELAYALPERSSVELRVYDLAGRLVRRLDSGWKEAGVHRSLWQGEDEEGRQVSTGIYLVKLTLGGEIRTQKVVHIR